MYQRGDLDWIGEPLSEIPPEAFKRKTFDNKISYHPIAALHWYELNTKLVPFSSKKCRRALAIAMNRKDIIDKLFGGSEKSAFSLLPPGLSQHSEPYFRDGDLQFAKQLFEATARVGKAK